MASSSHWTQMGQDKTSFLTGLFHDWVYDLFPKAVEQESKPDKIPLRTQYSANFEEMLPRGSRSLDAADNANIDKRTKHGRIL